MDSPKHMTEKTKAKHKQLANADLNFVSNKPLEYIADEMQNIKRKDVQVEMVQANDDTTLFQMTYSRDDRTTAEVVGRLQRWAGNMTHVYCDGRIFRKKLTYVSMLARWTIILALGAPFVLCPLTYTTGGAAQAFFGIIFMGSVIAFMLVGLGIGFYFMIERVLTILNVSRKNPKQGLSKPERKDRERLLHFLTDIIRDDFATTNQLAYDTGEAEPLSEAEITAILQQAEMMARLKK